MTTDPAAAARRSETILFFGQSNAGGGGDDAPLLVGPLSPGRVLTFGSRRHLYGTNRAAAGDLAQLQPLTDGPKATPRPATAMGFALAGAAYAAMPADLAFFLFTIWHGNQPLGSFVKGTAPWHNLISAAGASRQPLEAEGLPGEISALVFLQGENGPKGRGPYRQAFEALLDEVLEALRGQTGQAERPICLLLQVNRNSETAHPPSGVELAQWDVAQARGDVVMAGPSYHLPLYDRIHHQAIGRLIAGEQLAFAYARTRAGVKFQPLHPLEATRDGRNICLRFSRPSDGGDLVWDKRWVASSANFGFAYADAAGAAGLGRVAITGPSEVVLTLDRAPAGEGVVRYAQGQANVAGWASARGQLMSPTRHPSYFHGLGYRVPRTINHYCLRAEIAVA